MVLKDKHFLVMGTGKSGTAAACLLKKQQITAALYDGNAGLDKEAFYQNNPLLKGIPLYCGELPEEVAKATDILILSPGVPADLAFVQGLRDKGIVVWGEVELAYVCSKGKLLAITGTNGKTTTTALLGEILKSHYLDVKIVGNIGIPYTSIASETTSETVTVAEISSFQLETAHTFAPQVTAILNITPDHLDRHHTMANYVAAKEGIVKNQGPNDLCVLNYEDEELRRFGGGLCVRVCWFSSKRRLKDGFYLEDGVIYSSKSGQRKALVKTEELNLLGMHNYENAMAAAAMAAGFGVPSSKIRETLLKFQAVEHRIEYVAEIRGVRFYNDSKGTNPDAAIKGICAMDRPTFLIGGGYDKNASYDAWIDSFGGKVKGLVLIGATREKIRDAAISRGFTAVTMADSLEEAVRFCYGHAVSGDAVLLSPACASWGMFANYEERGRKFKEIVNQLKE